MKFKPFVIIIFTLCAVSLVNSKSKIPDYLLGCWEKEVKPINHQFIQYSYRESAYRLYHSFEPWQQINTKTAGTISLNRAFYYQKDSLKTSKYIYKSQTQFDNKVLLYMGLGDTSLSKVSKNDFLEEPLEILRYSPVFIIGKFKNAHVKPDRSNNDSFSVYTMKINKALVGLYIRRSDSLAVKITTQEDDDLYGDVMNTYSYKDYSHLAGLNFAKSIYIEKTNGRIEDSIDIFSATYMDKPGAIMIKPKGYKMEDEVPKKPDFTVEPYSDHIHFMNLKHTDDKVVIVEFKDFILCAEAPINSKNGELIIQEAQKIPPGKPIKYFVFCHFHPHYIGGIRAFIHKGATIISPASDSSYVQYLTENKHTINPDSLQSEPHPLKMECVKDSFIITDGSYDMKIYFIGKKSQHTSDYMIYYFPKEKMVFEGDLVWINKNKPAKAGKRDIGLYNTIKDLKLDVSTIIQSWPVNNYDMKTTIPFSELEESVNQNQPLKK